MDDPEAQVGVPPSRQGTSKREPHGCVRPNILLRRAAAETATVACCRHLTRLLAPIARVKSRSQYEIALVHQRFEPDTAAMLAKSIAATENYFAQVKKPIEGLLGALAKITPKFKGIGRFFDG
jgi:hypothetical protein